jgi:hypothetical protein
MNATRFDTIAKLFAARSSRRQALTQAGASLVVALAAQTRNADATHRPIDTSGAVQQPDGGATYGGATVDPLTDPANCGGRGVRCPLNEECIAGRCRCDGVLGSVAPFTCWLGEGGYCHVPGNDGWWLADVGGVAPEVPPGYAPCAGTVCKVACPSGTACEPAGFCRRSPTRRSRLARAFGGAAND